MGAVLAKTTRNLQLDMAIDSTTHVRRLYCHIALTVGKPNALCVTLPWITGCLSMKLLHLKFYCSVVN